MPQPAADLDLARPGRLCEEVDRHARERGHHPVGPGRAELALNVGALTPLIGAYAKERADGERFGDFVIRKGLVAATTSGTDFPRQSRAGAERRLMRCQSQRATDT
jgi:hypothetical protein